MTISTTMPKYRLLDLFNKNWVRIFALRHYQISVNECVKTQRYFKLMPGYSFVRLGGVAASFQRLSRAGLFLLPSFSSLLNTATNG